MNKHYTHALVGRTTCTYKYPPMHTPPQRTHEDIQTRVLTRRRGLSNWVETGGGTETRWKDWDAATVYFKEDH